MYIKAGKSQRSSMTYTRSTADALRSPPPPDTLAIQALEQWNEQREERARLELEREEQRLHNEIRARLNEERQQRLQEQQLIARSNKSRPQSPRTELRRVFEQFDNDGSGTISREELEAVLDAANISMSPEAIDQLISEADMDHDGEIDYEEFMSKLKRELDSGSAGGLVSVVKQASSIFSWLNPLEWFSAKQEGSQAAQESMKPLESPGVHEADSLATVNIGLPASEPAQIHVPGKPINRVLMYPDRHDDGLHAASDMPFQQQQSVVSVHGDGKARKRVKSQKTVLSDFIVKERNAMLAEEQRVAEQRMAAFKKGQKNQYCDYTKRKIEIFQQQEIERRAAAEALAATKRETGVQMRLTLQAAYQLVQSKAQKRNAEVSAKTMQVRQAKKAETEKRHEEQRKYGQMIALQAAEERRKRREQSLATVRAQQQAARDFAAKVKYETRPAVRQETREFFQEQRNAVCAHERAMREEGRILREDEQNAFIEKAMSTIAQARATSGPGVRASQEKLKRKHFREADEVRQLLISEHNRRQERESSAEMNVQAKYQAAMSEKFNPEEHDMRGLRAPLRESLKARTLIGRHALYEC